MAGSASLGTMIPVQDGDDRPSPDPAWILNRPALRMRGRWVCGWHVMSKGWWALAGEMMAQERDPSLRRDYGDVIRIASERTGNAPTMLKKMTRCRAYVELRCSDHVSEALRLMPLSHVEVLARADAIDHGAATQRAEEMIGSPGTTTYRGLVEWLDGLKSRVFEAGGADMALRPHKGMAFRFKATCLDVARSGALAPLYADLPFDPPIDFRPWKGGHALFVPHVVGWRDHGGEGGPSRGYDMDAIVCYLPHEVDAAGLAREHVLVAVGIASYVRCLWLMVERSQSDRYEGLLNALGPGNVGLVRVDAVTGGVERAIAPSGAPVPDRRGMLDGMDMRVPSRRAKRRSGIVNETLTGAA